MACSAHPARDDLPRIRGEQPPKVRPTPHGQHAFDDQLSIAVDVQSRAVILLKSGRQGHRYPAVLLSQTPPPLPWPSAPQTARSPREAMPRVIPERRRARDRRARRRSRSSSRGGCRDELLGGQREGSGRCRPRRRCRRRGQWRHGASARDGFDVAGSLAAQDDARGGRAWAIVMSADQRGQHAGWSRWNGSGPPWSDRVDPGRTIARPRRQAMLMARSGFPGRPRRRSSPSHPAARYGRSTWPYTKSTASRASLPSASR